MKKLGTILAVLSLVAMAPSYAYGKKAGKYHAAKQTNQQAKKVDDSSWFNGLNTCIRFVDNGSSGDDNNSGSFFKPYATIQAAAEKSAEGCIIYVKNTGMAYDIDSYTGPVMLKKRQILVGSSIGLKIEGKQIPALTTGRPEILINSVSPGIVVDDGTQVVGFVITGSGSENGIESNGSGGLAGSCLISNNSFSNLKEAILLTIQANAKTIEIESNRFSDVQIGVDLIPSDGAVMRICRNHFEEIQTLAINSNLGGLSLKDQDIARSGKRSDRPTNMSGCPCQPDGKLLTEKGSVKNTSRTKQLSTGDLFIEGNTFENSSNATLITVYAANTLDIRNNKASNSNEFFYLHFPQKLTLTNNSSSVAQSAGQIFLSSTQKATATRNTFDVQGGLDVELSGGAVAHLEHNTFSNGTGRGLQLGLDNGSTACLEKNTFSNNEDVGLFVSATASTTANCLQLEGNKGENNSVYTGVDFVIQNGSSVDLFQADISDNVGLLTVVGGNIELVEECPGCAHSR